MYCVKSQIHAVSLSTLSGGGDDDGSLSRPAPHPFKRFSLCREKSSQKIEKTLRLVLFLAGSDLLSVILNNVYWPLFSHATLS